MTKTVVVGYNPEIDALHLDTHFRTTRTDWP